MRDGLNPLSRGLALLALLTSAEAHAVEVRFECVSDLVYSFIGEMGARTATNEGRQGAKPVTI
jgi:hypothetical protein